MNAARIRAAQYLRMSTENQQYSIPSQSAAIGRYAEQNGFVVVRSYTDAGRSGLHLRNRPGLSALLQDVLRGETAFRAVLVYDVSRWGRFQDTDEAAHYEFLCRSRGIPIHYCAEQFANDMALPSMILKSLKRSMAAEYSRELSVRVYGALRRVVEEGFHVGSTPGYGFRRMLLSADGTPKQVLKDGEEKSLRTERVRLVLGPPEEIRVVRLIYRMLLVDGLRPTEIMRELNRRGITFHGRPWSFYAVKHVLTHPKYCGLHIWGRTESKLKTSPKRIPSASWITAPVRGPRIVSEDTFLQAQHAYLDRTDQKANEQLLDALRSLWKRQGYLTEDMVEQSHITPRVSTYRRRFGTLRHAFELIGYHPCNSRCLRRRLRSRRDSEKLRADLIRRLCAMFPGVVVRAHYHGCIHCPQAQTDVAVSLCRARAIEGRRIWFASLRRQQKNAVTLLCLLNDSNDGFHAFYIFPRLQVKHWTRIYEDGSLLARGTRLRSLADFYRAVAEAHQQIADCERVREDEELCGVPQIAMSLGLSTGVVRRLIREGMPVVGRGRGLSAIPKRVHDWLAEHGSAWTPKRDQLGRYIRSSRA